MFGLWWLDRGARSNQVQALMRGSLGDYLSPLQYTTKEMPVSSCSSPGGQFFVVDLAARISPWRSKVCGTERWVSAEFKPPACQPVRLSGQLSAVRMFPPVVIDQSLPGFQTRQFCICKS